MYILLDVQPLEMSIKELAAAFLHHVGQSQMRVFTQPYPFPPPF